MDETEASVIQKTPSGLGELPFYFVKAWPKDVDPKSRIREAVKLFEEMDKRHFQMSAKIKRKLFEWEQEVSRLGDLKYYHQKVLRKIQIQTSVLGKLNLEIHNLSSDSETLWWRTTKSECRKDQGADIHENLELHNLSSASETRRWRTTKSECKKEQGSDIHKLNFLMLHRTKKLSEENKLLRDMNLRQQKEVSATALPLHSYNEEIRISTEAERKSNNTANKSMRKTIQGVCDELMELKEENKTVEASIKKAEKMLEVIKKEIRSWVKQLKDKQNRKEAYFCMLDQIRIYNEECWVLQYRNLLESDHSCMIYMDKSSSRWTGSCRNWILSYSINCL